MPADIQTITDLDELLHNDGGAFQVDWLDFPIPDDPGPPPVAASFKSLQPNLPLTKALRIYDYDECRITVEAPKQNLTVSRCGPFFDFDLDDDEDLLLGHSRPPSPTLVGVNLKFAPGLMKLGARVSAFADAGDFYTAQLEVRLDGEVAFRPPLMSTQMTLSSTRRNAPLLAVRALNGRHIEEARFSVRDTQGAQALRRVAIGRLYFLPG
jgi:hypothetical protein